MKLINLSTTNLDVHITTIKMIAKVQSARIPVVDICSQKNSESAIAQELLEAAIDNGFVYIKNTGQDIPIEAIDHIFEYV